MIDRLRRILGRPEPSAATVTLYTRAGCSCCDKAKAVLERARKRHRFAIETIDVDGDPELAARYGLEVPVVAVDGRVRFRGVVNPVLLERLLAGRG
jgi:glutaredoxin